MNYAIITHHVNNFITLAQLDEFKKFFDRRDNIETMGLKKLTDLGDDLYWQISKIQHATYAPDPVDIFTYERCYKWLQYASIDSDLEHLFWTELWRLDLDGGLDECIDVSDFYEVIIGIQEELYN